MKHAVIIAALAVLAVIAAALFFWRKKARKRKQDQEQIDRKMKEEALDRALANGPHRSADIRAQVPVEVHYSSRTEKETGGMLRLTEQSGAVTKEYLFRQTERICIGEEYDGAVVFRGQGKGRLYCELFPYRDGVCVRLCGGLPCSLVRGKRRMPLASKAVRLHSGDRIETRTGSFLIEFI